MGQAPGARGVLQGDEGIGHAHLDGRLPGRRPCPGRWVHDRAPGGRTAHQRRQRPRPEGVLDVGVPVGALAGEGDEQLPTPHGARVDGDAGERHALGAREGLPQAKVVEQGLKRVAFVDRHR